MAPRASAAQTYCADSSARPKRMEVIMSHATPSSLDSANALNRAAKLSSLPHPQSIVFVVDDDVSVRTSLELLIDSAGWQSRIYWEYPVSRQGAVSRSESFCTKGRFLFVDGTVDQ